MLSYQHQYHAGNHADIIKHICLTYILNSLNKKDKPYTVMDIHAGSGIYNLESEEALKTGEAKNGIKKLITFYDRTSAKFPESLENYINAQKIYLENSKYAGSSRLILDFSRQKDQLHFCELHPDAFKNLEANLKNDKTKGKINLYKADCWETLHKITPPLIKRGLILIDPSYEDTSDYSKVIEAVKEAHKKWNTAIIAVWYPLLTRKKNETSQLIAGLETIAKLGTENSEFVNCVLKIDDEEFLSKKDDAPHLFGSGMFVINAPWKLDEEMEKSISFIEKILKEFH